MKIKTNANGQVDFILMSNGAKVKGSMLASEALNLVHSGEVTKKGNTFIVNDKFVFEIDGEDTTEVVEEVVETTDETPEEVVEEVKEEDRPLTPRSKKNKRKNG